MRYGCRGSASTGNAYRGTGQQVIGVFNQDIQRNLDMHWTWPRAIEYGECAGQDHRQVIGTHQGMRERRHPGHQAALGRQFMQLAAPATELIARLHTGDHQHRDRVGISLAHRGGDVGHPRAGDDEADARLATGTRIAISHEACALLVTWGDMPDRGTRQPAVELDGMHAGNPEDMIDAVAFKEFDQYFTASCHVRLPVIVLKTGFIGPPPRYRHNAKKLILAMSTDHG
ncbi:hypothetical protein D3C81_1018600 [compost metagenome]